MDWIFLLWPEYNRRKSNVEPKEAALNTSITATGLDYKNGPWKLEEEDLEKLWESKNFNSNTWRLGKFFMNIWIRWSFAKKIKNLNILYYWLLSYQTHQSNWDLYMLKKIICKLYLLPKEAVNWTKHYVVKTKQWTQSLVPLIKIYLPNKIVDLSFRHIKLRIHASMSGT